MIKKLVPKKFKKILNPFRSKIRVLKNSIEDYKFYANNSATQNNKKNKATHSSELIFYYHKIEKGLALPAPRVGFGKEAILYLIDSLEQYVKRYGWDKVSQISLNTLIQYYEFNLKNKNELDNLYKRIKNLKQSLGNQIFSNEGGTIVTSEEEILKYSAINFKDFAASRYSIRNFSDKEVSNELIIDAVKIAQKTPSVCNRQSSKVHIFSNKEIQNLALSFQNGNAGFGDKAGKILLVTANVADFFGAGERHQAYVDGGMFAMSLIYGLHSLGLGSCALNLALEFKQVLKFKEALGINQNEIPIMLVAVGHIPKNLRVAASPRKDIEEIIKIY